MENTSLLQPVDSVPPSPNLELIKVDGKSQNVSEGIKNNEYCAPPVLASLPRHLNLTDLICIGVGGTVGSGIFSLCGLIANSYAGPATFLSWAIAGVAACLSGFSLAELAGKIPEAGSAYSYASVTIGEYPAFVAACCLSLNYVGSASAVARSWGDKVRNWAVADLGEDHLLSRVCDPLPSWGINPMAFFIAAGSVTLLLKGVQESKWATNVFTYLKVGLVAFMVLVGLSVADFQTNLHPIVPPEFGVRGVFRGATSCFFGYIGFDEACCLGGEAINPQRNMPRAVILTITIVTILYMAAAVVLTGMQPYWEISGESGFPNAFRANEIEWAVQISTVGEIVTLPIVVLISILAEPRLLWAVSKDGLISPVFSEVDDRGNLWKGTFYAGSVMVVVATFVPFTYLDDTISTGILLAFCITNWSVISLRYQSPENEEDSTKLDWLLFAFNALSMISGLLSKHADNPVFFYTASAAVIFFFVLIIRMPKGTVPSGNDGYYHAPLVPFLPMMGIYVNWYLIAQLEVTGIILLLSYILVATVFYFMYSKKHSRGKRKKRGWKNYQDRKHYLSGGGT